MSERRGIKLPASLLNEIGLSNTKANSNFRKAQGPHTSRKAVRKAARIEKRRKPEPSVIRRNHVVQQRMTTRQSSSSSEDDISEDEEARDIPPRRSKPDKDIVSNTGSRNKQISGSKDLPKDHTKETKLPRRVREKLAEDDAEIAALERRLGLKNRKKLPKSFDEDGLGDLLADLGASDAEEQTEHQRKKPRLSKEEEDWLQAKRSKAIGGKTRPEPPSQDEDSSSENEDIEQDTFSNDEVDDSSSDDFEEFEDETTRSSDEPRRRENPYIAPTTIETAKYIPPSLRISNAGDTEGLQRLRRQIQGTLNRLSEAKVLAIAADIEKIYRENPRQHVSTIILDTLFALICDPSPLQDTFMILHGGFVAALYKTIGSEFGAQVVQRFIDEYDRVSALDSNAVGKQLPNLITFLAELYNFQVIGSALIYDIIRNLTTNLTEDTAELLLRIARISGSQLRQDDSASLKDIVTLLHGAVERQGAENLSIRTKFMIETIENLKNNKVKTGIAASNIRVEHTTAMKKTLGSINRSIVKASEPLRIGLQDIRNADKKGKWWLIGASFKHASDSAIKTTNHSTKALQTNVERNDEIDLDQLAREQGMNTEIRRAIFISIVSAYDHKEACTRLTKLGMKSKQKLEIPRVVVHCVGAEKNYYNRFYTKIAKHLCNDRNLRKAFSFALWDVFKRLEDDEDMGDEDQILGQLDTTAVVYIAKMYGELVADAIQNILLLKHVDLAHPGAQMRTFTEVFLITIFQNLSNSSKDYTRKVKDTFTVVEQAPEIIAGLQLFLKKTIRSTKLVQDPKDKDVIKKGCKVAEAVLFELMSNDIGRSELSELI